MGFSVLWIALRDTVDLKFEHASSDLLSAPNSVTADPDGDSAGASKVRSGTGILPLQELEYLVKSTREIVALEPIQDDQFQPASIDLRLGTTAYRVRASFLPGRSTVMRRDGT